MEPGFSMQEYVAQPACRDVANPYDMNGGCDSWRSGYFLPGLVVQHSSKMLINGDPAR